MTEEPARRAPQAPQAPQTPAPSRGEGAGPDRPPQGHTALRETAPAVMVCLTRCYPCQFDEHPGRPHTWMAQDDAEHAGHPWPLPDETAAENPCGCRCAEEPR